MTPVSITVAASNRVREPIELSTFANGRGAIEDIALAFVAARRLARPLPAYPGILPPDMETAYAVQEEAIARWPDQIAGWKVGLVPPPLQAAIGTNRLIGPIFRRGLVRAEDGEPVRLAAITGGFAAIEAELVAVCAADAPEGKTDWTIEEAARLVGTWHIGVEFAASPLATINDLGPTVVASDFGNNSGLVHGRLVSAAIAADPTSLSCRSFVAGEEVGAATAASLPGGPIEAFRFILGLLARRGRPLLAGQLVSTGAITGVHRIFPGQSARVEFDGQGSIDILVVQAEPMAP